MIELCYKIFLRLPVPLRLGSDQTPYPQLQWLGFFLTSSKSSLDPKIYSYKSDSNVNFSSLQGSHVQNPFLLRRGVQQVYHCVFSTTEKDESLVDTRGIPSHSLFRTFMILAIASVLVFRKGDHPHHPYGYFLSAMQHLDDSLLSRGLDSIQDLLLVGRFGIYHHIGELLLGMLMC
jgi:hypothetical protein